MPLPLLGSVAAGHRTIRFLLFLGTHAERCIISQANHVYLTEVCTVKADCCCGLHENATPFLLPRDYYGPGRGKRATAETPQVREDRSDRIDLSAGHRQKDFADDAYSCFCLVLSVPSHPSSKLSLINYNKQLPNGRIKWTLDTGQCSGRKE
jgi:hypothetical protein